MGLLGQFGEQHGGLPFSRAGEIVRHGAALFAGRVIGEYLDESGVMKRKLEEPLQKARIAALTVQQAMETDDDELLQRGVAMGAQAILFTQDPPLEAYVPPHVSDAVAGITGSLPLGDIGTNPYISASDAQRVETFLEQNCDFPKA